MTEQGRAAKHEPHDWHSPEYVRGWLLEDISDDRGRLRIFAHMFDQATRGRAAPLKILDVGGGHGVLAEAALRAFPDSCVTLLDFSLAMIETARRRLAPFADRMTYLLCDLASPKWSRNFHQGFDLAVSSFAIHNLEEPALIAAAFRCVADVLQPGATFVNQDFVRFSGGLQAHVAWLREAGFDPVTTSLLEPDTPILIGVKA